MNRTRRLAAVLGRRVAAEGFHWVAPDLSGTGESSGSLEEATVDVWVEQLLAVAEAFGSGTHAFGIVGLRFGALLATAALLEGLPAGTLVLWQPLINGGDQVRELIKQRSLAERLRGERFDPAEIERSLDQGKGIELAGYRVGAELMRTMADLKLDDLDLLRVENRHWIDVSSSADQSERSAFSARYGFRRSCIDEPLPFWLQPDGPLPGESISAIAGVFRA